MKLPFWPSPLGYRNINLGLNRVNQLLERLNNPQKKLPPVIHIAGTNGKGSTLSFLKAIFEENNYLVSCYTSPHLVRFNERIILNGKEIDDNFLNKCLLSCMNAASIQPEIEVTYFEGITVAAFLAFSKTKSDILLLETGMGGLLDATNVVTNNLLSIITPISFDHQEFLGKNLADIALQKSGIIKNNCPVIISKQAKSALKVISSQALEKNSKTYIHGIDWKYSIKSNNKFIYEDKHNKILLDSPKLKGEHQVVNASSAISAALNQKELKIDKSKLNDAIKKAFWPARLENVYSGKYYNILKTKYSDFELIVDGSHNSDGAKTLNKFLNKIHNKKIIIFSMVDDKDCREFLNIIKKNVDLLIITEIINEKKSKPLNEIKLVADQLNINNLAYIKLQDVFEELVKMNIDNNFTAIICGSLYLAGNFIEQNNL